MSDITFACPKCHQSLDAPEEIVGNLIECPTCKLIIEVPIRSQAAESPTAPIPTLNPAPPPPPTQPESNHNVALFYICRNGQTVEGPLPADQLFSMIQRKELVPSVLVCVAGTDTWHPLNTMTDLSLAPAENSSDIASHRLLFGIGLCVAAVLLILFITLPGPSKQDKVALEVLSIEVDTFIMKVDLEGQIGTLNKHSAENSVLYQKCIAESNRLAKVFSRQPDILNALRQQEYILKRWGNVNDGLENVTPRERKEDKKTLYDLKPKFDSLAR